ncbi:MAG: hypothetical protein ACXWID_13990 [Pyrinomonadaceae bacterium]
MKERQSYFSGVFLAPVFLLTVLVIIMGLFSPVLAQQADSYKTTAAQAPSLADAPLEFKVVSQRKMINGSYQYAGWTPVISGRMLGRTRSGDAVMVELAQDGKLLHTLRGGLKGTGGETWFEDWEIRGDDTKDMLTAVGKLTATFKYYNDTDEKTTPLTVRKFDVVKLVNYDEGKNSWKYGALYDDLLGFSYLVERQPENSAPGFVWVYTWMNLQHDSAIKDISYKLSVDGNPVPLDDAFDANQNHESIVTLDQREEIFVKAKNDRVVNPHNVYLVVFRPKLLWGPKRGAPGPGWLWLADHPGKWILKIRIAGQVVRELRFTVLPNGEVALHPEQDRTKSGFLNLGPGRFFAETYFPNPNAFDLRFNPDAIRRGTLYGRPWISTEVTGGMVKTLPPKNPGMMPFPQPSLPATE